ncbi:kinase-like protein [Trametes versicolor FP-101664 SS1]|uniref:Kinase-like protein n=1 Tax=Trametes versicolor (strain FP-101664) TaxID=717944 RepID=R7S6E3_TRAVS|nr:kinase-like protein [Trametes versicolor FP-101664 SS1]EIW51508.1 kinase-like protein [Trametes versicolor FP-101664 SS1]
MQQPAVRILSSSVLAKKVGGTYYDDPLDEVYAMQRARALGVNVPAFRRLVPIDDFGSYYLVMERVIGDTLEQLWRSMSLWGTLRAAWQLRGYLRLLHTVTAQTTGGLHSGRTRSIWLDDQRGPVRHASPAAFVGYLNWWLVNCRPEYCTSYPELVLKPAKDHILVHQDLAPRNMILDSHGTLYLVDWGISGFYPEYMEYFGIDATSSLCSMQWLRERTWAAWWGRLRWSLFRWVAAGSGSRFRDAWKAFGVISIRTQHFRLDKTPFSDEL